MEVFEADLFYPETNIRKSPFAPRLHFSYSVHGQDTIFTAVNRDLPAAGDLRQRVADFMIPSGHIPSVL